MLHYESLQNNWAGPRGSEDARYIVTMYSVETVHDSDARMAAMRLGMHLLSEADHWDIWLFSAQIEIHSEGNEGRAESRPNGDTICHDVSSRPYKRGPDQCVRTGKYGDM